MCGLIVCALATITRAAGNTAANTAANVCAACTGRPDRLTRSNPGSSWLISTGSEASPSPVPSYLNACWYVL